MSYDWGPHYIVPSRALEDYGGHMLLREQFDEALLRKELQELGIAGCITRVTNYWYCRRKGSDRWLEIGESDDALRDFPVKWDTTWLENGQYQIMGLMRASIRSDSQPHCGVVCLAKGQYEKYGYGPLTVKRNPQGAAVARLRVVEVTVKN